MYVLFPKAQRNYVTFAVFESCSKNHSTFTTSECIISALDQSFLSTETMLPLCFTMTQTRLRNRSRGQVQLHPG